MRTKGSRKMKRLSSADREMIRRNLALTPEKRVEKAQAAARLLLEIRGLARART